MGIFKKATEYRVDQILRNTFGQDVPIDFSFGASSMLVTGADIERCVIAVNNDAIFILNNARVANLIPWENVLDFNDDSGPDHFYLTYLSQVRNQQYVLSQYPSGYWHVSSTHSYDKNATQKMKEKYLSLKLQQGFTEESLIIHRKWLEFTVTQPAPITKFHQQNENWQTEEIREVYYKKWLEYLDSECLIGFVGRAICEGVIPGPILNLTINEWKTTNNELGNTYGSLKEFNEKFYELVDLTKNLSANRDSETWVIGKVEIQPFESEVAPIIPFRRVATKVVPKGQGHPSIQIWNDFHKGDSGVIFDPDKFKTSRVARVNSLQVFFDEENTSRAFEVWSKN